MHFRIPFVRKKAHLIEFYESDMHFTYTFRKEKSAFGQKTGDSDMGSNIHLQPYEIARFTG